MDELVDRLVARVGIDRATAVKAIGIILGFLRSDGPSDKVEAIIAALPGASDAIAATRGGAFGGLMGGGIMAVGSKLAAIGLSMDQIKRVAREIFAFGTEKIGPDAMNEIVGATPGLSQFV
jgi:hypothetical protein